MELRKLTIKDKEAYFAYLNDWKSEEIIPTSTQFTEETFESYLNKLREEEGGRGEWVPAETYFYFTHHGEIAGAINCRYDLNDFLREIGGHIGYGIAPSFRKQGLAKDMLEKVLTIYREKGFKKVLLTADDTNTGSVRTILSQNGIKTESGIKENAIPYGKYWIEL
jgi:predicted acetyltransferase